MSIIAPGTAPDEQHPQAAVTAQADALRTAAAFVVRAATAYLTVAVCGDGEIRVIVERHAGPAAARIRAVAALAASAGATTPAWSTLTRGMHAYGRLSGHRLSICTFIGKDEETA